MLRVHNRNPVHSIARQCVDGGVTYSVQVVWDTQVIQVRHNAAPAVGAAEIVSGRLTDVREIRRLLSRDRRMVEIVNEGEEGNEVRGKHGKSKRESHRA